MSLKERIMESQRCQKTRKQIIEELSQDVSLYFRVWEYKFGKKSSIRKRRQN
jgi:hypothetical protein